MRWTELSLWSVGSGNCQSSFGFLDVCWLGLVPLGPAFGNTIKPSQNKIPSSRATQGWKAAKAAEIWFHNHRIIDLLLTDVIMPGWTRPQIARELLAARPDLKINFTSGYDLQTAIETASMVKGAKFLSKPYSIQKLLEIARASFDEPPDP